MLSRYVWIPGLRLVSEANVREHPLKTWRRKNDQQNLVRVAFLRAQIAELSPALRRVTGSVVVEITRVAPRAFDTDNLQISAKHVRDEIAFWLAPIYPARRRGDDSPTGPIRWAPVQQRKGAPGEYGVEVRISLAAKEAA
jgi:hypothetical protein